jgi:hypothetical protein
MLMIFWVVVLHINGLILMFFLLSLFKDVDEFLDLYKAYDDFFV